MSNADLILIFIIIAAVFTAIRSMIASGKKRDCGCGCSGSCLCCRKRQ